PRHGRRLGFGRQVLLLAALAVIAMGVVGGTVAYLVTKTGSVVNTFTPGVVSCKIDETFDGTTKSNVYVTNTGYTNAYIRATYVVTWRDAEDNIVVSVPDGYSYTLTENPDSNWTKRTDGYFYYPTPVAPGNSTQGSLLNCTVTYPANPEYTLSVEILADAIQSSPESAVIQAWGFNPSSGN
ncbi:MAG: hypothetical protein PUG87_00100, partial [Eubacteriales bacterium]|nr:hypothetical protein [Eubacteriales bacterium]